MKLTICLLMIMFLHTTLYPVREGWWGKLKGRGRAAHVIPPANFVPAIQPAEDQQAQSMREKNKKNIPWNGARGHRFVTIQNVTEYVIKIKMENGGNQYVKVKTVNTEQDAWAKLQAEWEQHSEWKTIEPHKHALFPIPVRYTLPKNGRVSFIEYVYDESDVLVRAAQKTEREVLKNQRIHLKKAVLDQALYQVKIKNNEFTLSQKNKKKDRALNGKA